MDWLSRAIERGAPLSYVLLIVQVYLLAMLVERSVFLIFKAQINTTKFLAMLKKLTDAGSVDRALKLCSAVQSPVGRVCHVGLLGIGKDPFLLTEELDGVIAAELPRIHRRLGTIPLLALGVAVLGVIGTQLAGASGANNGSHGPLPFGLAEEHALGFVGVTAGIVGVVWWLALASKAKRVASDLMRCKAVALEIATGPK